MGDDLPADAKGVNRPLFIGVGAYLTLLGGWHVIETVPLPIRGARAEGYPDWPDCYATARRGRPRSSACPGRRRWRSSRCCTRGS